MVAGDPAQTENQNQQDTTPPAQNERTLVHMEPHVGRENRATVHPRDLQIMDAMYHRLIAESRALGQANKENK